MGPEYPKIQTLFERGEDFAVQPDKLKNPCYALIDRWIWTEKIDGTNIRIDWDNLTKKITIGGRTNNAQIPGDLVKNIYELVDVSKLEEVFPDVNVTLYGEGYGAGIQKGGAYSATKKFILFDVLVGDKWWLNTFNTQDVAVKLGIDHVPVIGQMPIHEAAVFTQLGFNSALTADGVIFPRAEGLVGRPLETLFDKNGDRMIIKIKTKDFKA